MNVDVDKSFFYKLHLLKTSYDAISDRVLQQHADIVVSHFILLSVISRFQPISQQEIAGYVTITPGAISRQVGLLCDKGLLTIEIDDKDRRKQVIKLSPHGQKTYEAGATRLRELALFIFGNETKREECIHMMEHLLQRIDAYPDN